jgi:hypothetical protein
MKIINHYNAHFVLWFNYFWGEFTIIENHKWDWFVFLLVIWLVSPKPSRKEGQKKRDL